MLVMHKASIAIVLALSAALAGNARAQIYPPGGINNQPVIQYGAVLSVLLWVPSFIALVFARRVISSGSFARGFGG